MMLDMVLYISVLSPSYHYALFIYIPGVYAALILAALQEGVFSLNTMKEEFTKFDQIMLPFAIVIGYFL